MNSKLIHWRNYCIGLKTPSSFHQWSNEDKIPTTEKTTKTTISCVVWNPWNLRWIPKSIILCSRRCMLQHHRFCYVKFPECIPLCLRCLQITNRRQETAPCEANAPVNIAVAWVLAENIGKVHGQQDKPYKTPWCRMYIVWKLFLKSDHLISSKQIVRRQNGFVRNKPIYIHNMYTYNIIHKYITRYTLWFSFSLPKEKKLLSLNIISCVGKGWNPCQNQPMLKCSGVGQGFLGFPIRIHGLGCINITPAFTINNNHMQVNLPQYGSYG